MSARYLTFTDPTAKKTLIVSGGGAHSLVDLQFNGDIANGETFVQGSQVCFNAAGFIEAGLETATSMPMWAINGAAEMDAGQTAYNLRKPAKAGGQGVANCIVGTGGFEIVTTEYNDEDYVAADYVKGSGLLTNDTANPGWIMPAPAAYSTVTVLGCVSSGVDSAREGVNRARLRLGQKALLHLWTMFVPPVNLGS